MKNRSLVLLSGEGTTLPLAEARALFLTYDPASEFEVPSPRLLLVRSSADPFSVGSRIAYGRRVGVLLEEKAANYKPLAGKRVRFRCFDLVPGKAPPDPSKYLSGIDADVDLDAPEFEVTLVRAEQEFLAITKPGSMRQAWSQRRPRRRAYFHPSAIFPKLARALFNLSRCREGQVFLDPFAGTGSIPLEAHLCGASVVAVDQSREMVRGMAENMRKFGQEWMGVLRADSTFPPLTKVDAVATDIPYGRASSSRGRTPEEVIESAMATLGGITGPPSHLVLMHPQTAEVKGSSNLALVEEHHLHVHKLLTRTISVLRRR